MTPTQKRAEIKSKVKELLKIQQKQQLKYLDKVINSELAIEKIMTSNNWSFPKDIATAILEKSSSQYSASGCRKSIQKEHKANVEFVKSLL